MNKEYALALQEAMRQARESAEKLKDALRANSTTISGTSTSNSYITNTFTPNYGTTSVPWTNPYTTPNTTPPNYIIPSTWSPGVVGSFPSSILWGPPEEPMPGDRFLIDGDTVYPLGD